MDHQKLLEFKKLGLIDKNQKYHSKLRRDLNFTIGQTIFLAQPGSYTTSYQLKKINTNQYLINNAGHLEFITYQNNDYFQVMTSFFLVYDDLLCSIIPCNNTNLIVCYQDGKMAIKKYLACLLDNVTTVFCLGDANHLGISDHQNQQVIDQDKNAEPEIVEKSETSKTNLVNFSQLKILDAKNFGWLGIVTSQPKYIPEYLTTRIYAHPNLSYYFGQESLLFLEYLVKNYNILPEKVCFIGHFPISYYVNGHKQIHLSLEDFISDQTDHYKLLDLRINLDGDRIRYQESSWYDYRPNQNVKITQKLFWSHIIKMAPKENYLRYASSNSRLVSRNVLRGYSLGFYQNLLNKYLNSRLYSLNYLDKAWDTLYFNFFNNVIKGI